MPDTVPSESLIRFFCRRADENFSASSELDLNSVVPSFINLIFLYYSYTCILIRLTVVQSTPSLNMECQITDVCGKLSILAMRRGDKGDEAERGKIMVCDHPFS